MSRGQSSLSSFDMARFARRTFGPDLMDNPGLLEELVLRSQGPSRFRPSS